MKARLTPRALADLESIRDYLVPLNPREAENIRAAIADTIELLEDFPQCGRATDMDHIRVLPIVRYPYLVYHFVTDSEVIVVHIRHAARDVPQREDVSEF